MTSRTGKVFALSLGKAMTSFVILVSSMVLARVLTKHDFATVRQTLLAYQFAAPLLMLGLPQAVFYFLSGEKKRPRGVLIDNLMLLVILGCVFSLFLALGGNQLLAARFDNPELAKTLKWMIPYPLFVMPVALLGGTMIIKERVTTLSVYEVLTKAVLALAIIGSAWWTKSYTGPLIAHIVVPAMVLPIGLYLAFSSTPGQWVLPSMSSMKQMLKFSLPLGIASMFGTINLQLDKVIVSALTSPEDFAVYVNGAVEIPLIGIITGSITAVVLVDMRRHVIEGQYQEAVRLFRLTAEKTSYILFPVMVFLFISGDSFIQTLFSIKYAESVVPFRWYLLLLPVRTVVFGSLLMAMGKTRVILFRAMVAFVINAVLSVICVRLFGPWGAALATVITMYVWVTTYNLNVLSKLFSIPWHGFFPLQIWGKTMIFLVFPSVVLLSALVLTQGLPAPFQLAVHGTVFWGIIVFWWNGKIYSARNIRNKLITDFHSDKRTLIS